MSKSTVFICIQVYSRVCKYYSDAFRKRITNHCDSTMHWFCATKNLFKSSCNIWGNWNNDRHFKDMRHSNLHHHLIVYVRIEFNTFYIFNTFLRIEYTHNLQREFLSNSARNIWNDCFKTWLWHCDRSWNLALLLWAKQQ